MTAATTEPFSHKLWMRLHGLAAIADGLLMVVVGRDCGLQLKTCVWEIQHGKR